MPTPREGRGLHYHTRLLAQYPTHRPDPDFLKRCLECLSPHVPRDERDLLWKLMRLDRNEDV